jgi:nitronate monooxygenase
MDNSFATDMANAAGTNLWHFRGRALLPVVQGGMGVGVSAGRLAGTVASFNGVGTISSVDLRRLHPDLWEQTEHLEGPDAKPVIDAANREALDREIRKARALSGGRGLIAVNVMKALDQYATYVQQALESGADALAVGAGLPLDLPELAKDFPHVGLIPILSDARGVQLLVRKWEKKGRLPDAIVLEHPRLAGGHLGAAKIADLNDRRFDFEVSIPEVLEFFAKSGLKIPLIAAGGISSSEDVRHLQALGASAVQLGTAFAVTVESDASNAFKEVLAGAQPQDMVEFTSVAGLPARAVRTPWLDKYLRIQDRMQKAAHAKTHCTMWFDCLANCGLRDGHASWGQFCIDKVLGHAFDGDVRKGLFFRGAGRVPFGKQIRPVQDLLNWLVPTLVPPAHAAAIAVAPSKLAEVPVA